MIGTVAIKVSSLRAIRRLFCILLALTVVLLAIHVGTFRPSRSFNSSQDLTYANQMDENALGLPPTRASQEDAPNDISPDDERPLGSDRDVVLNELMLQPNEGGPWVEIHNSADEPITVDDWLISDEDGLTYQLPNLPDMPPGSYIVVHFDHGESETYFGQSQPNALHLYTGWKNVRWTRYVVDSDFHYARAAMGHDIIQGGKPEIIANHFGGNRVYLYEPQPDMTLEWAMTPILGTGGAHRVKLADIDDDTHTDMVYDLYFGNEGGGAFSVNWMRAPQTTPKDPWLGPYNIAQIRRPEGLDAGRINGDNLMDIVVGGKFNDDIFWFESPPDPTVGPWIQHNIDLNFRQPGDLVLVDLDTDGDLDLVAAGSNGEEVAWYEHPVNPANAWPKHIIEPIPADPSPPTCSEFDAVGELIVWDIDEDSKLDVVVSEAQRNRIVWYKYDVDPTGNWDSYIIDDSIAGPSGMDFGDIDKDGDLDIVVGAVGGLIAWYPQPVQLYDPNWPRYIVDNSVHLPFYVNATDFDSDGDLDLVAADQNDNRILWFESEFLEFTAQDQAALYNASQPAVENIVDFIAWGGPALGEDALAVNAGIWQDDTFVDMTSSGPNLTLARDKSSQDIDVPGDWDTVNGMDSDIPTPGMRNYPNPTNVQLSVEYIPYVFEGGSDSPDGSPPASMPAGLCLANYSSYTFGLNVSNPFGWNDLWQVIMVLDPGGADIGLVWLPPTGFAILDPFEYVDFILDATVGWTDNVYNWHLNFTIFFHWWFPSEGLQDVSVTSINGHGYRDTDLFPNQYRLVRSLTFANPMVVRDSETGQQLGADEWVRPGLEIGVTGPVVVYDVPGDWYYPSDSQFNVVLTDGRGNSWTDYTSAGYPVSFSFQIPLGTLAGQYDLTMAMVDVPNGAIVSGTPSHRLVVDNSSPQYLNPSPGSTTWNTDDSPECGVRIHDFQPGSGVDGVTIEYRLANGSVDRLGEWMPAPIQGSNDILDPRVTCDFPDGPDNWIQWRAKDVAGNGPMTSPTFRVPVDAHGVTFHGFAPPQSVVQNKTAVTVNITIADFGGSGVDTSTIQVAIKPSGETSYGAWLDTGFTILNQSDPISDVIASGPEALRISVVLSGLQNGTGNYVKFRAQDVAGNEFTESEEYNIPIAFGPSHPEIVIPELGVLDYLWLIILVTMIVVLVVVTVLNRKRKSPPDEEQS
jgi:hypothetical protein